MTIQITLIGLGQIGTSIGLALTGQSSLLQRTGHDRAPEIARQAEKLGALDRVEFNLHAAVSGADLVLLSLPMDQIRTTLEMIAPDLKAGAVVMDTAPIKEVVSAWAGELLPTGRYYVGLTPVLNPSFLHAPDAGIEAAHADLFRGGLLAIVAPPRTASEAIKLAADLTRLLGATPLFSDPLEMDGLMAATHLLPQLVAAALLNATIDQPGWQEGRKVAGKAYAEATAPLGMVTSAETMSASAMFNRDNLLRMLDGMTASLQALRTDLQEGNTQALEERLGRAQAGRAKWWRERQVGKWLGPEATPALDDNSPSNVFGRMLGLGKRPKKSK
jgi:prephenate dehydrogenase